MKFACERCGKRFSSVDEPTPGRVYRIRCRCGNVIQLSAPKRMPEAAPRAKGGMAPRPLAAGGPPHAVPPLPTAARTATPAGDAGAPVRPAAPPARVAAASRPAPSLDPFAAHAAAAPRQGASVELDPLPPPAAAPREGAGLDVPFAPPPPVAPRRAVLSVDLEPFPPAPSPPAPSRGAPGIELDPFTPSPDPPLPGDVSLELEPLTPAPGAVPARAEPDPFARGATPPGLSLAPPHRDARALPICEPPFALDPLPFDPAPAPLDAPPSPAVPQDDPFQPVPRAPRLDFETTAPVFPSKNAAAPAEPPPAAKQPLAAIGGRGASRSAGASGPDEVTSLDASASQRGAPARAPGRRGKLLATAAAAIVVAGAGAYAWTSRTPPPSQQAPRAERAQQAQPDDRPAVAQRSAPAQASPGAQAPAAPEPSAGSAAASPAAAAPQRAQNAGGAISAELPQAPQPQRASATASEAPRTPAADPGAEAQRAAAAEVKRRAEAERRASAGAERAAAARKAEASRQADAQRDAEARRKAEAQRRAGAERKAEAERVAGSGGTARPERAPPPATAAAPEGAGPPRQPDAPAAIDAPVRKEDAAAPKAAPAAEGLAAADLQAGLRSSSAALDACVEQALADPATAAYAGRKVSLIILVAPSGRAEAALEEPDLDAAPFGACVRRAAARMSFPAFQGEPVGARIPLVLARG